MSGWRASNKPASMRVKWALPLLLLFLLAPVSANDGQPDSELLEYLGEWTGTDEDWSDPVDILDMNFDDKQEIVTENE